MKSDSPTAVSASLVAMIMAFLGSKTTTLVLFLAPIRGAVVGATLVLDQRKSSRNRAIPIKPFLSFAAIVAILFGDQPIHRYVNWIAAK